MQKGNLLLIAAILAIVSVAAFSQTQSTKQGTGKATNTVHSEMLVSTPWLSQHLNDPKLVLVHMGNAADYKAMHIPGARFLSMDKIAGPGVELLPDEQLKSNLEAIGISDDPHVVIYGDWDPAAARLFFTLDYIGFQGTASLLDGSLEKWVLENRPTSTDEPKFARGSLTVTPHPEVVAKIDAVKSWTAAPGSVALIDARPIRRFHSGHLAGAAPLFWEKSLVSDTNPVLKTPQELRALFTQAGAAPGKKVVTYCETGQQASYAYFVARYLGYDVALYDGSYSEWSAANQPVVRGK